MTREEAAADAAPRRPEKGMAVAAFLEEFLTAFETLQ